MLVAGQNKRCVLSALPLVFLLFISIMAETEYRVGVKSGGWAKYDGWFYQRRDVFQGDLEPIPAHGLNDTITIRVLKVSGKNVTWREVRRRLDGLVHFDETLTADPTKPYYWPPEYKVHVFFIPSNFETGELIPQPLGWDPFEPGWPQYVNETIVRSLFGVKRQVNHIQSHRVHTFEGSEEILSGIITLIRRRV